MFAACGLKSCCKQCWLLKDCGQALHARSRLCHSRGVHRCTGSITCWEVLSAWHPLWLGSGDAFCVQSSAADALAHTKCGMRSRMCMCPHPCNAISQRRRAVRSVQAGAGPLGMHCALTKVK